MVKKCCPRWRELTPAARRRNHATSNIYAQEAPFQKGVEMQANSIMAPKAHHNKRPQAMVGKVFPEEILRA